MLRLCETVMTSTMAELRARRDAAVDADLVELRLDGLAPTELDVRAALADRVKPVIITCRAAWEGGRFTGGEDERLRVLAEASAGGAEYVDVEWRADWASIRDAGRSTMVLSHHDFDGVPADLASRVRAMRATGAPIVKIAVTANRLADCVVLRDIVREDHGERVAIAMGDCGVMSRLLAPTFGSSWTYAGTAAAGQMSASVMRHQYRVTTSSPATRVFGLAGKPVGHSASPAMHNAAFRAAGVDAVYVPFETDDADELLRVADAFGVEGLSVTAPLKASLLTRVEADDHGHAIGAVNTLRRTARGWEAGNFDAAAFLEPLERRAIPLAGRRAVILGAGGAARAAAWALRERGADVVIAARDPERAERLARALDVNTAPWPPAPDWDLLVNATPIGTSPRVDVAPIARDLVRGPIVYDLIYNPSETMLLRWAREAGAVTIGGLEMLVEQAVQQFAWWTDRRVERAIFEAAATQFIAETSRCAAPDFVRNL